MATIVLRNVKGSPLTNNEVDNNFTNLNNDKLEISGSSAMTGKLTTVVSSTSTASIRLTQGSGDPSSPVSGDFWNNAGNLKFYDGASVYTLATVTGTQTLTNKTLAAPIITTGLYFEGATEDAYELLLNVVDPTQDRTVTIPDATTTMVGTDVAQTLTNKTLTTPVIEEIDSPANILLDAAADIILDAGGADVILKDDGVEFGKLVNSGGQLAINSGPSSTTAITFSGANVTVVGNLTVSGTTTTVNTETILLADNIITLNSNLSGSTAPSENAGIEINRGSSTAVVFRWNEGTDVWEYTKDGTTYFTLVGLTESQTLTNKTIAAASNTISGLTNTNLSGTAGITNANLANSTISGVALGNNLNALTIGTGLSGTSYNGSSAVTIAIDTGTVVTLTGSQTLTNKNLSDATTFFIDDADATKKMTFQLSGITSGQIRTLTVPNVSGTIVTTGDTGSISNAMLANSTISGISLGSSLNTLTIGSGLTGTSYNGSAAVTIAIGTGSVSNAMLANSSITVNGTIFSLGGSGTVTATATNALTIGSGLTGTSYNGSAAVTIAIGTGAVSNAMLTNSTITINGSAVSLGGSITISAQATPNALTFGSGLTGTAATFNGGTAVTVSVDTTVVATLSGVQTLTNKTIAAASNTISGLTNSNLSGTAGITNANLANSSITVNGTAISLGSSGTVTATATNALTIGTGLSGTSYNGSSAVTIANTGVLSITGTTNQITASASTGAITLSLPQNIHTTASPSFTAVTTGNGIVYNTLAFSGSQGVVGTISAHDFVLRSSAVGRLTVESSGNIYINNSLGVGATTGGTNEIRAAGEITAYYTSDVRLKENVVTLSRALDKVVQIRGVSFDWTQEHVDSRGGEDGYFVRKHDVGVIAQEIEAVLPEVVAERENGFKAVRYEKIVPLLIEAIKELKAEIAVLKTTK